MTTGMESGQSINITFYFKGFNSQVTVRDPELPVEPLIDKAIEAIEYGITKGLKPSWNEETNKEALKEVYTQPPKQYKPQTIEEFEKVCNRCGAEKVLNPKTGKWFCKDKCWLK